MSQENCIPLTCDHVTFEGALGLETVADGVKPIRVPANNRDLFDDLLVMRASFPTGVRLTTLTDARWIALDIFSPGEGQCTIDLAVDGQLLPTQCYATGSPQRVCWDDLPGGLKRVEIYLPVWEQTTIRGLAVNSGGRCFPWRDPRPRWITHGSSITACRAATSPARTWPAITARTHDWHLTNLGYGGQCLLDQAIARVIARQPADFISLCLGINTYHSAFNQRTWPSAALGFILTVRDGHPETPVLIMSPIHSPPRETTPGSTGLTLPFMRATLQRIVQTLRSHGDERIFYLDGLTVFNEGDVSMLLDNLHPNGQGYELMGHRMATELDRLMMAPESAPAFAKMRRGTR